MKTTKFIQHTADNGDIYEATRATRVDAWDINYPTGGTRMHGTPAEVRAEMRRIAKVESCED